MIFNKLYNSVTFVNTHTISQVLDSVVKGFQAGRFCESYTSEAATKTSVFEDDKMRMGQWSQYVSN